MSWTRSKAWVVVLACGLVVGVWLFRSCHDLASVRTVAGAMPHSAYVWQRAWTPALTNALASHGTNFAAIVALKAEVQWSARTAVTRVPVDYDALRASGAKIGLALRAGSYRGRFAEDDPACRLLSELGVEMIAESGANGISLAELQIDFDCAESKLDGYRLWVEAIRKRVAPVPVTITALPSWLNQKSFRKLIDASDGYVLQVHSFAPPRSSDGPLTLCDPAAARRAVERAGRLGKPFRVALPTYGYLVGFDPTGRVLGVSAEGPSLAWPTNAIVREVRADPAAMAALVQDWSTRRPAELTGVIWYRFPISGERLNWRWQTLSMVLAGRVPHSDVRAEAHFASPALVEVELINAGTADQALDLSLTLRWRDGRVVSSDGSMGFETVDAGPQAIEFRRTADDLPQLGPGTRRKVGWVRFERETEVQVECKRTE